MWSPKSTPVECELLDEHQSFVSTYESGERRLDLMELKQVCKALGVSILDFVERFEKPKRGSRRRK